jgi:hypothetical protein
MNIQRDEVTGAINIRARTDGGELLTRTYFGYTERECVLLFRDEPQRENQKHVRESNR